MTDARGGSDVVDQESIIRSIDRETAALLDLVLGDFLEIDLQGTVVLDGLTGGHVLTYLSREADRMADELLSAAGRPVPRVDTERRWELQQGGLRPGAVLIEDLTESADRLSDALSGMGDWSRYDAAVRDLPAQRLVQLIVHHADLGRPWDSVPEEDAAIAVSRLLHVMPAELAGIRLLARPGASWFRDQTRDGETVIEGDPRRLLAWASGRSAAAESVDTDRAQPGHRVWF